MAAALQQQQLPPFAGDEEQNADDARELSHLLSDDEDAGSSRAALFTESVMAILSRLAPASGDEYVTLSQAVAMMNAGR